MLEDKAYDELGGAWHTEEVAQLLLFSVQGTRLDLMVKVRARDQMVMPA